jgi:glycosyltransferase involved in cell wall biosynthesis
MRGEFFETFSVALDCWPSCIPDASLTATPHVMNCRFLYLIGQLRSGGSERQLYYLLKTINRTYYRPAVVVWDFREADTYVAKIRALGIPIYSLASGLSRVMKLWALRGLLSQIRPEVVHSYSFYTNFAAFWATRGTKAIALGSVRGDFEWTKEGTGAFLGRLSSRWPSDQIFNSDAAAQAAQRCKSMFSPKNCLAVRNGIDLECFSHLPLPANGQVQILGVGSLFAVKRWDRLVSGALVLKQRGANFSIRIVGDGPLRDLLKQQAQDLGVSDQVELAGYSDNVPGFMGVSNFLVHTSDAEGCPNVVMEAMACGRAVVATDVGDVPFLVENGKTGFVVARGDDAKLLDRLLTLITNRDLCRRMGEAGRAKAEREFGLHRLVEKTMIAYTEAGWNAS